jgi:hypothetical protein
MGVRYSIRYGRCVNIFLFSCYIPSFHSQTPPAPDRCGAAPAWALAGACRPAPGAPLTTPGESCPTASGAGARQRKNAVCFSYSPPRTQRLEALEARPRPPPSPNCTPASTPCPGHALPRGGRAVEPAPWSRTRGGQPTEVLAWPRGVSRGCSLAGSALQCPSHVLSSACRFLPVVGMRTY